jgi:hypothetical protein
MLMTYPWFGHMDHNKLKDFDYLKSMQQNIQFAMENKVDGYLSFLDI